MRKPPVRTYPLVNIAIAGSKKTIPILEVMKFAIMDFHSIERCCSSQLIDLT
jgi:hypothetical protein